MPEKKTAAQTAASSVGAPVPTAEEAKTLVATDPVVVKGEMVPEFHPLYASAALMLVPEGHQKISKPAQ